MNNPTLVGHFPGGLAVKLVMPPGHATPRRFARVLEEARLAREFAARATDRTSHKFVERVIPPSYTIIQPGEAGYDEAVAARLATENTPGLSERDRQAIETAKQKRAKKHGQSTTRDGAGAD